MGWHKRMVLACAGLVIGFLLLTQTAGAASLTWDLPGPATGDWFQAANWSLDLVPTAADDATIANQGTATISSASSLKR